MTPGRTDKEIESDEAGDRWEKDYWERGER